MLSLVPTVVSNKPQIAYKLSGHRKRGASPPTDPTQTVRGQGKDHALVAASFADILQAVADPEVSHWEGSRILGANRLRYLGSRSARTEAPHAPIYKGRSVWRNTLSPLGMGPGEASGVPPPRKMHFNTCCIF